MKKKLPINMLVDNPSMERLIEHMDKYIEKYREFKNSQLPTHEKAYCLAAIFVNMQSIASQWEKLWLQYPGMYNYEVPSFESGNNQGVPVKPSKHNCFRCGLTPLQTTEQFTVRLSDKWCPVCGKFIVYAPDYDGSFSCKIRETEEVIYISNR